MPWPRSNRTSHRDEGALSAPRSMKEVGSTHAATGVTSARTPLPSSATRQRWNTFLLIPSRRQNSEAVRPLPAWRENSSRHVASLRRIRLLFFIAPVSSTITGRDYPQWTDLRKYVAELPVTAVLPSHAHRVRAFLRKSRVIDDPMTRQIFLQQTRQHLCRHRREQPPITPVRIRHQVMHRLMRRAYVLGLNTCRHRLDALATSRQHQTTQIPLRRHAPICVGQRRTDHFSVLLKPTFQALSHHRPLAVTEDPGTIS